VETCLWHRTLTLGVGYPRDLKDKLCRTELSVNTRLLYFRCGQLRQILTDIQNSFTIMKTWKNLWDLNKKASRNTLWNTAVLKVSCPCFLHCLVPLTSWITISAFVSILLVYSPPPNSWISLGDKPPDPHYTCTLVLRHSPCPFSHFANNPIRYDDAETCIRYTGSMNRHLQVCLKPKFHYADFTVVDVCNKPMTSPRQEAGKSTISQFFSSLL